MKELYRPLIVFLMIFEFLLFSASQLICQPNQQRTGNPRPVMGTGVVTHENDDFEARLILARVRIINAKDTLASGVHAYLVEGSNGALLIDTDWGKGNLAEFVTSITKLPLTVVNTHGDPDHSGHNDQFEKVYIDPKDISLLRYKDNAVPLNDGHIFDLGDRKIEVISIPGHTPGHIALLDSDAKIIFTGDEVTISGTWMHIPRCTPLEVYLESMKKLKKRSGEFECCFGGHLQTPVDTHLLTEIIQNTENILAGKVPEVKTNAGRFGGEALVARFDRSVILYNKEKLWKNQQK